MSDDAWLKDFAALAEFCLSVEGDPTDLRSLVFGLYLLLLRGPKSVQEAFEGCSEEDLTWDLNDLAIGMSRGSLDILPLPTDLGAATALAGRLLRAAEAALVDFGELARAPRRARDLEVVYGHDRGWLLPFPPRFRRPSTGWPPYFEKRGLTRLRCIPQVLNPGHAIELAVIDADVATQVIGGVCLFEEIVAFGRDGLRIDENTTGPFVFTALQERDPNTLREALEESSKLGGGADIVLFPELSVTPENREEIQQLLRTRPWDPELSMKRPILVIAGSWHHERGDGKFENRAPVLNAGGELVGEHVKHMPYTTEKLREDIVPGKGILVVATRDITVAVAICLDFCQTGRANPYDELDVDLVLVTSYANQATLESHGRQAKRLWDRRKTATFLVQQAEEGVFGSSGVEPPDEGSFATVASSLVTHRKIERPS